MEVYVLVARRRNMLVQLAACFTLALSIVLVLMSCRYPVFLAFSVVGFAGWYFLQFRTFKEYEYSYFDGELRFARIMNKSRRKAIRSFHMDDVIIIAPSEDRSVYKYMNDEQVRKVDYTSGHKDVPYYVIITKNNETITLYKIEPDEQYLDAIALKYRQKLVRRVVTETSEEHEAE